MYLIKDFENQYEKILYYFEFSPENSQCYFYDILNIRDEMKHNFINFKEDLDYLYNDLYHQKELDDKLDDIFCNNFNMPLLPKNEIYFINYDNLDINSHLISIPIIYKKNNSLKCNYNKISIQKGPFYPELYSNPIILNIVSLVDENIKAEIHEFLDNNKKEEKQILNNINENIFEIEKKDNYSNIYMKIKNYFQPKEPIQIKIYIPKNDKKYIIENQIIRRLLKLTSGDINCEIEIEIKLLIKPIEILLLCKNYKLEYLNNYYYLKSKLLYSKEKLIIEFRNYFEGENIIIKSRIDSLEGNTSKEPLINLEDNKLIVNIPELNDLDPKRLHCIIECYISLNFKISIIIDCAIIPLNDKFEIINESLNIKNNEKNDSLKNLYMK